MAGSWSHVHGPVPAGRKSAGGRLDAMEPGAAPMTVAAEEPGNSVGRVQGLRDSTPLLWHVAVQDGSYLQLDDVVVTVRDVPGRGLVMTSGIVAEVSARHEGASFGSDVFLISDGVLQAAVQDVDGVSTKTSCALFLLHAMFRGDALRDPHNAKALIFSVKGEDLLFLDQANRRLTGPDGDALRGDYARLGLPAEPYRSTAFYAPAPPGARRGRP